MTTGRFTLSSTSSEPYLEEKFPCYAFLPLFLFFTLFASALLGAPTQEDERKQKIKELEAQIERKKQEIKGLEKELEGLQVVDGGQILKPEAFAVGQKGRFPPQDDKFYFKVEQFFKDGNLTIIPVVFVR